MGNYVYTETEKLKKEKLLSSLMDAKYNYWQTKFVRNEIDALFAVVCTINVDSDKANEKLKKLFRKWKFDYENNFSDNEFCYEIGDKLNKWCENEQLIKYED
jgi:hypothetical protein